MVVQGSSVMFSRFFSSFPTCPWGLLTAEWLALAALSNRASLARKISMNCNQLVATSVEIAPNRGNSAKIILFQINDQHLAKFG